MTLHFTYVFIITPLRFLGSTGQTSSGGILQNNGLKKTGISNFGWQRFTTAFCHSELLCVDDLHAGYTYCPRYLPQPGQEALTLRRNMAHKSEKDLVLLKNTISCLPVALSAPLEYAPTE